MSKFTSRELQKCAEREAALRRRVYAKHGKTSATAMMEEIMGDGDQPPLPA